MSGNAALGPLAALEGNWEGDEGVDSSFNHAAGKVTENVYTEKITFKTIGPVDSGKQTLWGLEYQTFAIRKGEDEPFHTEVGYWLWDADRGEVMRCFMVPRGSTILAGGSAKADSTTLKMSAKTGSETFGILSNPYLHENAKAVEYNLEIQIDGDTWSYEEDLLMEMAGSKEILHHTDKNRLKRA